MADFNKRLMDLQNKSGKMQESLLNLLKEYDGLFREANTVYMTQRMASGSEGLEEFHHLLLLIRRNRDIMGSLNQGARNIRPIGQFKFVEEDFPKERETPAQIRQKRKSEKHSAPVAAPTASLHDIEAPVEELEVTNG